MNRGAGSGNQGYEPVGSDAGDSVGAADEPP